MPTYRVLYSWTRSGVFTVEAPDEATAERLVIDHTETPASPYDDFDNGEASVLEETTDPDDLDYPDITACLACQAPVSQHSAKPVSYQCDKHQEETTP
tara:strand:+ start:1919 stop:2212 length:294 start_codon:yes stop_codon:yes gene_type:complete